MDGIYGCGCKKLYIDFLVLLIPTPCICSFLNVFCSFYTSTKEDIKNQSNREAIAFLQ